MCSVTRWTQWVSFQLYVRFSTTTAPPVTFHHHTHLHSHLNTCCGSQPLIHFPLRELFLPSTLDKCMFAHSLTFWTTCAHINTHANTQFTHIENTHTLTSLPVGMHPYEYRAYGQQGGRWAFPIGSSASFLFITLPGGWTPTIKISFIFIDMSRRKRHSRELGSISLGLQCF